MRYRIPAIFFALALVTGAVTPRAADALGPQSSARMDKAKDYIADEQWARAIDVLKAASVDPKERNKDEALFWLAHSLHQARRLAEAVETIADLERNYPKSRWVKPARSLRVELAQKLHRNDVLWWTATAPAFPAAMTPVPASPAVPVPARGTPPPRPENPRAAPPAMPSPMAFPPPAARTPAPTPRPPAVWVSEYSAWDPDVRILALGGLINIDAARVIPILRDIALESSNPHEATRAVFVLAQSGRPEAHSTVLELAKSASEPVCVAAVRELGRFGGPRVTQDLLQVYGSGNQRVKYQVVNSLGERAAAGALMQIAVSEADGGLRDTAIVTLGQAGGRVQLQRLYARGRTAWKRPIILGLFNARAEDELIQIADRESDAEIRREVLARLRLLGTPKAKQYVEKAEASR